ncbi:aldolase, partial [Klebsiella pneumoniae]
PRRTAGSAVVGGDAARGMDLRRQTVERGHFSPGGLFAQPGLQGDRPLAQPLSDRALLPAGARALLQS